MPAIPAWAVYAAAGVLTVVAIGLIYNEGERSGRLEVESANKQATFDQLLERRKTDETVSKFTPAELCAAIGGKLRNGKCE